MKPVHRRIQEDYNYKKSQEKFLRFEKIRFMAEELAMLIADLCPEGLELEEALKKTREAAMWAHAGIAREPCLTTAKQNTSPSSPLSPDNS